MGKAVEADLTPGRRGVVISRQMSLFPSQDPPAPPLPDSPPSAKVAAVVPGARAEKPALSVGDMFVLDGRQFQMERTEPGQVIAVDCEAYVPIRRVFCNIARLEERLGRKIAM